MALGPVDEIKSKIDIADLVGESVTLKKSGRNFSAPCPFHSERTPSFYVFPDRQSWHCFGACATGGDIFSFVMRRENIEFPEALRLLAQRAGVALPNPRVSQERASRAERLKGVNRAAAIFFHDALLTSKEAAAAREHLSARGISADSIENFRLGYCPEDRRPLERQLLADGFTEHEWQAAGIVRTRDDGSGYNLFHGRLMIPIMDERSDYVAFGARTLTDSQPKYLNSPQSEVFEKSALLYGMHRAKEGIRATKVGVIVEGYMDVIIPHQYGFANVVAPMGTALTERHVALLTRLASRFVLALDPDAAGDEATLRTLESSWHIMDQPGRQSQARLTGPQAARPELFVMNLPREKDPDDVIREDPKHWQELVESATPVIDHVFKTVVGRMAGQSPAEKAAVTQRLAPLIQSAPSLFERNERVKKLAELLHEQENIVQRAVTEVRPGKKEQRARVPVTAFEGRAKGSLEAYCLATLLRYPELIPAAQSLRPDHFLEAHYREIFRLLSTGVPTEELVSHLDEALSDDLTSLLEFPLQPGIHSDRQFGLAQCIARLEEQALKLQLQSVTLRQRAGELTMTEASDQAHALMGRLRHLHSTRQDHAALTI